MAGPIRVLFVCMGNICRSPLAEAVFMHKVRGRGIAKQFSVDSAGTGRWHVGEPADPRAATVAARRGIKLTSRARQVSSDDFQRFDYLVCMDNDNLHQLERRGAPPQKLHLLLAFDRQAKGQDVPDPYFGGDDGFDRMYELIDTACDALLEALLDERR